MSSSWKPRLEALESREVPALFGHIGDVMQIVYAPEDPTAPPPPPPSGGGGGTVVISAPAPTPWIPGH